MKFITNQPLFQLLGKAIPSDHSRLTEAHHLARQTTKEDEKITLLDLGCGVGNTIDLFASLLPNAEWHGVDLEESPEVGNRVRTDGNFASFDGVNLPYEDAYFDIVYCCQVFEHVRHPDRLMPEVFRILKPGGTLIASVSYLEPYHSYSVFNFTPYGVYSVLKSANLELEEIRPGIDGMTLIIRQLLGKPRWFRWFESHSIFYYLINAIGAVSRMSIQERNFLKIQFSGHLSFVGRRNQ